WRWAAAAPPTRRKSGHGFARIFTDQAKTMKILIRENPRQSVAVVKLFWNACKSQKVATVVRALPAIAGRRRQLAIARRCRFLSRAGISRARPGLARLGCR